MDNPLASVPDWVLFLLWFVCFILWMSYLIICFLFNKCGGKADIPVQLSVRKVSRIVNPPITWKAQILLYNNHRCQDILLHNVRLEENIARNQALKENVFMMVVCIELRIPLFLVGKPGSSKSLAKTIVSDAMQGTSAHTDLFRQLKQVLILLHLLYLWGRVPAQARNVSFRISVLWISWEPSLCTVWCVIFAILWLSSFNIIDGI